MKPNFVRIASGHFLTELVDDLASESLCNLVCERYEDLSFNDLEDAILTMAKELEDMYNTGIQVGIRESYKRLGG